MRRGQKRSEEMDLEPRGTTAVGDNPNRPGPRGRQDCRLVMESDILPPCVTHRTRHPRWHTLTGQYHRPGREVEYPERRFSVKG